MSTIYEIAKKAGVSPTTVSKVINNYPDVSDKTRSKIKKILNDENFYPNSHAQTLITKKHGHLELYITKIWGLD